MSEDTKNPKSTGAPQDATGGGVADKQPALPKDSGGSGEDLAAKYEKDIAKLKSSFQRQINDLDKRHRDELEAERQRQVQLQRDLLPEDKRPEFDKRLETDRLTRLEQENQALQAQLQERTIRQQWADYFQDKFGLDTSGIRADTVEEFVNAAHEELSVAMRKARQNVTSAQPQPTPQVQMPSIQAPDVDASPDAPATTGETWDVLIRKYGSAEEVYRRVEQGLLNPSIIPSK